MSYKVLTIPPFDKQLKTLAKKYPSLRKEYAALIDFLEVNPKTGIPLGKNCYKIRLAIASKGRGKSGGARLITHVQIIEHSVYFLSIYDKTEQDTVSDQEIIDLLKFLNA